MTSQAAACVQQGERKHAKKEGPPHLRAEAVAVLEVLQPGLAGCGFLPGAEGAEGEVAVELRGEEARHLQGSKAARVGRGSFSQRQRRLAP